MDERGKLVLGLKQGDTVRIGDDIEITVINTGSKANILFVAPKTTRILRDKLRWTDNAEGDADV